jgi:hypothetical protein
VARSRHVAYFVLAKLVPRTSFVASWSLRIHVERSWHLRPRALGVAVFPPSAVPYIGTQRETLMSRDERHTICKGGALIESTRALHPLEVAPTLGGCANAISAPPTSPPIPPVGAQWDPEVIPYLYLVEFTVGAFHDRGGQRSAMAVTGIRRGLSGAHSASHSGTRISLDAATIDLGELRTRSCGDPGLALDRAISVSISRKTVTYSLPEAIGLPWNVAGKSRANWLLELGIAQ